MCFRLNSWLHVFEPGIPNSGLMSSCKMEVIRDIIYCCVYLEKKKTLNPKPYEEIN